MSGASQTFQTLFANHDDGEGATVPPRFVLKMRIEKQGRFHFVISNSRARPIDTGFRQVGWDYTCSAWDEESVQRSGNLESNNSDKKDDHG